MRRALSAKAPRVTVVAVSAASITLLVASAGIDARRAPVHSEALHPSRDAIVTARTVHPPPRARDRWSEPIPGVRYLLREGRHADGAPLIVHVLYVPLCDPRVELRTTAPEEGGMTVSAWARRNDLAIAINGDFFDGPGPRPLGPARGAGRSWPDRGTYYFDAVLVARPGAMPAIVDGLPRTATHWTDAVASQERIVVDGELTLSPFVRHATNRHPRTAVGFSRDGRTLILVTVDGRSQRSAGVTTPELGALVRSLGAHNALRMDGGGSSAMYIRSRGVVNTPSDGHERQVANHIGVRISTRALRSEVIGCTAPPRAPSDSNP